MVWPIASDYLPSTAPGTGTGGLLATIEGGVGAPLATATYAPTLADQTVVLTPTTGTIAGSTYTLTTTADAVFAVGTSGGTIWRPATSVTSPAPGEFVFNPFTGTVTLTLGAGFQLVAGQAITLVAAVATVASTIALPAPVFARHVQLRDLSWSISLEGHPSGSLEIAANDFTLPAIKERLSKGTEFSLYGIGLRCGAMRVATASRRDYPVGLHVVSISLEGKWENYADEPFPWRNLGEFSAAQSDATADDEVVAATYTLAEIAAAVGATYQGPVGVVPVPENAGPGESTTLAQELADFTRINGSVLDWGADAAIAFKPVTQGRVWDYRGATLVQDSLVQEVGANSTPSTFTPSESLLLPEPVVGLPAIVGTVDTPTLREEPGSGIVIEWENVQLTGQFSEAPAADDSEDTLAGGGGRSRWVRRRREITTVAEGDTDAALPPTGAVAVKDVSLNFDQSGPTKTLTTTTKEDGFVTLVEQWRYGYAFTAAEVTNADGEINGSPSAWWALIEYTRKERQIDRARTGYAYGWDTTGWRLARFKQETATDPETFGMDSNDPELPLYQFERVPITELERDLLIQHRDVYDNIDVSGQRGEIITYTLPDGSTGYTYLRNPNYAEPMLVSASSREMVSFIDRANPDGEDLPRLISGREEYSRMVRKPEPGKRRVLRLGAGNPEQQGDRTPDRYTDYSSQFTAQDGQYNNSLEDTKFQDYEGRPGEADRLPPEYTQEEPPEGDGGSSTTDEATTNRLYLLNSGSPTQTLGQQFNYPRAATLEQALTAIRTDATLENLEQGTSEQVTILWNPDIRPGDQFIYLDNGEVRRRFVRSCQWQQEWTRDGMLGTVQLDLARWVEAGAALTLTAIDLPSEGSGDDGDGTGEVFIGNTFRKDFRLGELLTGAVVRSRVLGNY